MKRILSLFLSISLLLSVNVGTIQVSASAEDTTMIEKTNILADTTSGTLGVRSSGGYGSQRCPSVNGEKHLGVMFNIASGTAIAINNTKFSEPTYEFSFGTSTSYVQVQCDWEVLNNNNGNPGTFRALSVPDNSKIRFSGRVYNENEGNPTWTIEGYGTLTLDMLKANTWYKFDSLLDLTKSTNDFTVTFTEELSSASSAEGKTPHTFTRTATTGISVFTHYRIKSGASAGTSAFYDDLKVEYTQPTYEKAKILSVGSDGEVEDAQNVVTLNLSNGIPGLAKEHITITNKETTIVEEITSLNDATSQTVKVVLKNNLPNWSEYDVTIDALAFGEGAVQRTGSADPVAVTDITGEFRTKTPDFAMKNPEFTADGSTLNAKARVVNTSGDSKNFSFVFSTFDAEGRPISVVPTSHDGFASGSDAYLEANVPTNGADKFNFFVIDNWTYKNPLFGKSYIVNSLGEEVSPETALPGEAILSDAMTLGELDYDDVKISVNIDTKQAGIAYGVLYVYKAGATLSDLTDLKYAQTVFTASNGTLSKEILLPGELERDNEYTVEFVSDKLAQPAKKNFYYYTDDQLITNHKNAIVAAAKACSSSGELQEVMLGVNSAGEKVNNNFDLVGKDANINAYNKLTNKLNVFTRMLSTVSGVADYDALILLFNNSIAAQCAEELANQKALIHAQAKASTTAGGLMQVMLGIDSNENVINNNFEVITSDTLDAYMEKYNKIKNKAAVFSHMISAVNNVLDYDALIDLFEKATLAQWGKENTKPSTSSNNSSYGGTSNVVKETVNTPVATPEQGGASIATFSDMSGHWAQIYVEDLYKRGIMKGYEDGNFRGENSITRAELAKTLAEAFEIVSGQGKAFSDVASNSWYASYVASAASAGIVTGFEDGSFKPDTAVSRQDAALMLYRAMSLGRELPLGYTFFTDDLDISDYASGAIRTLGDLGIVSGNTSKQFKPLNSITRAEVATIICRAIDYIESH